MRPHSIVPICIAIVVTLSIAVSPAVAQRNFHLGLPVSDRESAKGEGAETDIRCQPVHGFIGEFISLEPCMYQGHFYEWCADFPIWGTLTGTLHYYTIPEMNREFEVPQGALGESWSFVVASAVVVIETKKGKVFAQDNALWHSSAVGPQFVEYEHITGGTDRYEGATGWIGIAGAEVALMTGEICTPAEK